MKKQTEVNVKELFKQFCKERHTEDKGRNYDMLQEVYAKTELFDLSFLSKENPDLSIFENGKIVDRKETPNELVSNHDFFKNLTLPFENQFIKLGKAKDTECCLMLREYEPFIITGTAYTKSFNFTLNIPFKINTEIGEIKVDLKGLYEYATYIRDAGGSEEYAQEGINFLYEITLGQVVFTFNSICNLPKHSVVTDTHKRAEYYTRKHGSTIKVIKPIYYVLDKKEEKNPIQYKKINPLGHCVFDHSFKVRAHWRRINENSLGVDRYGIRKVKGMTFIKEYVKGEGDLVKKIRILK